MCEILENFGWAIALIALGGMVGIALVAFGAALLPRLLNRVTPHIDEEKEIVRGNVAVAEYFGRIVAAGIIGLSIVVAAAVLGGIIAVFVQTVPAT